MTREEMIIAAEKYAHEQTGRDCRWADCEFCWVYRSDVPCKHREIMESSLPPTPPERRGVRTEEQEAYPQPLPKGGE